MKLPSLPPPHAQWDARKRRRALSRQPGMTLWPSTILLALLLCAPVWAVVALVIYFW